ncbi:MAG: hypothetical protein V4857_13380 [Pseudomonadota bacterium]
MNILKNMEAIFLAAVVLAGISGLANAPSAPVQADSASAVQAVR